MDKKYTNKMFKRGIGITAIVLIAMATLFLMNPVFAQAQDTCPATGDWVKIEGLAGKEYFYTAPEGYLIAETCYKAGTNLVFKSINPPQSSVTVISTVGNDLSHASFRLVAAPTPTETFTPTPTVTFTPTPTVTFTPTPTEELEFIPLSFAGVCSGSLVDLSTVEADDLYITWTVTNENNQPISFNWSANNGQSGSGTAPANGSANFITDTDGSSISLAYSFFNVDVQEQASVLPCDPQQETEEPTPQPTDSQPDEPAGGSGPSLIASIVPFIVGIPGIAAVSFILFKNGKKISS